MSTPNVPSPDQGQLFDILPQTGAIIPRDVLADPAPQDGPSVSIIERAAHLGRALTELGSASRLSGWQQASSSDEFPGLRRPLEQRYDDVDRITGHSQDAQERHMKTARQAFAHASGLPQLIDADPANTEEAKAFTASMFAEFTQKYADAKGAPHRKALRAQLRRQERAIQRSTRVKKAS